MAAGRTGVHADGCKASCRKVFHRIQHDRIVETVAKFNPHVLVHVGVWEPDARASQRPAASGQQPAATLTDQAATSILGAAAECSALERVVVRSGIEIYGRTRTRAPCTIAVRATPPPTGGRDAATSHVVGASTGGAISRIIAVKYPERTSSVTLACTAGRNHPWREELLVGWRDAALGREIGSMGRAEPEYQLRVAEETQLDEALAG